MTLTHFLILCNEYGIHPSIALENDELRQALKDRDEKKIHEIFNTQF
jgi:hypothetical protein